MSPKNKKGLYVVLGMAVLAAGAWYLYSHTKKAYATTIVKFGGASGFATLLTFDTAYLKAWAQSIKKGNATFSYQGKTYNTNGGMTA